MGSPPFLKVVEQGELDVNVDAVVGVDSGAESMQRMDSVASLLVELKQIITPMIRGHEFISIIYRTFEGTEGNVGKR